MWPWGVRTAVCRGGHGRTRSSLTCGFPLHTWPSVPSTASITQAARAGISPLPPKRWLRLLAHSLLQTYTDFLTGLSHLALGLEGFSCLPCLPLICLTQGCVWVKRSQSDQWPEVGTRAGSRVPPSQHCGVWEGSRPGPSPSPLPLCPPPQF